MTRWSVGDLARAGGLTVRTLHHHDEIGLDVASERTTSGHRRYTPDDVRRLYQVRSLRQLGLSLEEVRSALSRSDSQRPLFESYFIADQLGDLRSRGSTRIGWPAGDGLVDYVTQARAAR